MAEGKKGRPATTKSWMKHKRRNIVVILEDMDFFWDEDDLIKITKWHEAGYDFYQMGEFLNRDPDEVWAAAMHLARKDKIQRR